MGRQAGAPAAWRLPDGVLPPQLWPHLHCSSPIQPAPGRYSILCSELAAQGYLVLALEHGDGSACATRPPGATEWLLYQRMGDDDAKVSPRDASCGEP